jgi:hypothetical protein
MIYRFLNATKREIYIGTTEKQLDERLYDHALGDTEAIKHWDWYYDNIESEIIKENLPHQKAIELAHRLEEETPPDGWQIIQTGGM